MSGKMPHKRDMQESGSDYLWDRSGQPDPQIERMEIVLARLRHNRAAIPAFPANAFPTAPLPWREALLLNLTTARLAAAALIAAPTFAAPRVA